MVNLSTVAMALSAATSVKTLTENRNLREDLKTHTHEDGAVETATDGGEVSQKLDRLIEIEEKNQPSPRDKDAYASSTFDLDPGQTAQVTVEPTSGFNLRVKRIYFDRRTDHSYEINVAGDVTSVSHRAKYMSPKLVSQSDRVVASVTNNTGSTTTIDFEMEAWAEEP